MFDECVARRHNVYRASRSLDFTVSPFREKFKEN